jgi:hypothetical protein
LEEFADSIKKMEQIFDQKLKEMYFDKDKLISEIGDKESDLRISKREFEDKLDS